MRDAQTVATPWAQAWRQQLRAHRVAALGLGMALLAVLWLLLASGAE